MYNHHILTPENTESIKKIYKRQKVSHIKDDWYRVLVEDFDYIQTVQKDDQIEKMANNIF